MSLDSLPLELLALILSHVPQSPSALGFEYSFSITNNKPLKPHRILPPAMKSTGVEFLGTHDFYKYDIYSDVISARDVLALAATNWSMRRKVALLFFSKVRITSTKQMVENKSLLGGFLSSFSTKKLSSVSSSKNRDPIDDLVHFKNTSVKNSWGLYDSASIESWCLDSLILSAVKEITFDTNLIFPQERTKGFLRTSKPGWINLLLHEYSHSLVKANIEISDLKNWDGAIAHQLAKVLKEEVYGVEVSPDVKIGLIVRGKDINVILNACFPALSPSVTDIRIVMDSIQFLDSTSLINDTLAQFKNLQTLESFTKSSIEIIDRGDIVGRELRNPGLLDQVSDVLNTHNKNLKTMAIVPLSNFFNNPLVTNNIPDSVHSLCVSGSIWDPIGADHFWGDGVRKLMTEVKVMPNVEQLILLETPINLRLIQCPNLKSLSLGRFNFQFPGRALEDITYDCSIFSNFLKEYGKNLNRLRIDDVPIQLGTVLHLFQAIELHAPALTQLSIPTFYKHSNYHPGSFINLVSLFDYLRNHCPNLCGRLRNLTLPIWPQGVNFETLHGIVKWKKPSQNEGNSARLGNLPTEEEPSLLFPNIQQVIFVSTTSFPDPFFKNDFLSDYEDYSAATFPYLFRKIDYIKPTAWEILKYDWYSKNGGIFSSSTSGDDSLIKSELSDDCNPFSEDQIERIFKVCSNITRFYHYELHLDILRDISVIETQALEPQEPQIDEISINNRWHATGTPRREERREHIPKYFISTSKQWH